MTESIDALHAELAQIKAERDAALAREAAIAEENARLRAELSESDLRTREALDVQRVMGQVLSVVAAAPSDLSASLPAIGEAARQLTNSNAFGITVNQGDRALYFNSVARESIVLTGDQISQWSMPENRLPSTVAMLENRIVEVCGPVDSWAADFPLVARMTREAGSNGIAIFAVPLPDVVGGQGFAGLTGAAGSITVGRPAEIPFSEDDRRILLTLADQAVIAIQNARLFGELQKRNTEITEALRREEAGSAILRQISESPEQLEETLQAITEACLALTGCSSSIWTFEGDESVFYGAARAAHDVREVLPTGTRAPITEEGRLVLQTKAPAIYQLAAGVSETLDRALSATGLKQRIKSGAFVPVIRAGEVTALLILVDCDESVLPLVQSFADQAAIAIENARLIRELRESNRVVNENLDIQRVMGDVLGIVASTPTDLDATLPAIASAAQKLCDATGPATVHWIDGESLSKFVDTSVSTAPLEPEWVQSSFQSKIALEGTTVKFSGTFDEYARRWPYKAAEIGEQVARARGSSTTTGEINHLLGVPMRGRYGAIGALVISRLGGGPFTERNHSVMVALATQAVVAIENSKLFNQLKEKSEELEIASRHKSEFLANMSHELRTPLNAIIGYAELLQEECEDLGQQEFIPDLGKIHSAGKHLLTLISGILDLSKVEAGRMTMFLEDFDITTLITDADAIVRPMVEKNGNSFVIDCPADIGVMHADLVKVRQVLFNLLSNAAKFTQDGTITLTVRGHAEDNSIHMAITDTGIGMTEAQQERLFEAFSQASAETSRKYGGTGLGLALSREFCRMMGGDITVVSDHGRGSTFTVLLPRASVLVEEAS